MQAQKMAEEVKSRLATVNVEGEAGNNKVLVILDGNKSFKQIKIKDELLNPDRKDELEELIGIAFEKAMANAEEVSANQMKDLMSNMMPGLGNMFGQ